MLFEPPSASWLGGYCLPIVVAKECYSTCKKNHTEEQLIGIIKKRMLKEWKARKSTTITQD